MPADYLSRLPGAKDNIVSISAFDLFQTDLYDLQMKDDILQCIQTFRNTGQWPPLDDILQGIQTFRNTGHWPQTIPKQDQAYYTAMIDKLFQDKNKLVWVRLSNFNYPPDSAVPPYQVPERSHV
jgi:hypothetical protein